MSLITENNRQYYEGAQSFRLTGDKPSITTTFDTDLKFYGYSATNTSEYTLNNFKIYYSSTGAPSTWTEYTNEYTVLGNTLSVSNSALSQTFDSNFNNYVEVLTSELTMPITIGAKIEIPTSEWQSGQFGTSGFAYVTSVTEVGNETKIEWDGTFYGTARYSQVGDQVIVSNFLSNSISQAYFVVQLKKLDGGEYGSTSDNKAYGNVVEDNWGSYAYTKLGDVINNFLIAYVGAGKLIPSVKRTDVIFHAKRAMQEFSYDTLKSVNKLEVSIPHNLSIAMPQDYVNYVNLYWIDKSGVKRVIMPADMLTTNPTDLFLQNTKGIPVQDQFNDNIDTTSVTEDRWKNNILKERTDPEFIDDTILGLEYYYGWPQFGYGQLYGLDPQFANSNGYYTINERENKFSFSANLVDKIVVIEYISDGLSTDLGTRIPKLAEEALYAYLKHAILATRINQPEYIIQRLKKEANAQLRNAKIRLSNIKLDQIVQVMRGKSKQIKH